MIRFLFKLCVLLCLIFIGLSYFMPVKPNSAANGQAGAPAANEQAAQSAGIWAGAMALGAFISDMDGFCARNPQSCQTGKSLFGAMAARAGEGAAAAYQWLGAGLHKGAENTRQHLNAAETAAPPPADSAAAKAAAAGGRPQQDDIAALVKAAETAAPAGKKPAERAAKTPSGPVRPGGKPKTKREQAAAAAKPHHRGRKTAEQN